MSRRTSLLLPLLLAACSGGGGGGTPPGPAPTPTPSPSPSPSPSPTGDPLDQAINDAAAAILADTCRPAGPDCAWTDRAYSPVEFEMAPGNGEAVLIIDNLPRLPVRAIRFRKHIKGYFRLGEGGAANAATTGWRIPTALWSALDRFSGPTHVPSQRLAPIGDAAKQAYPDIAFDNVGHGSTVFSLLADNVPAQPLVLLDSIDLEDIAPTRYCDASGTAAVQAELVQAAQRAADAIVALMRANNVRFVNYSAGHTFQTVRDSWQAACAKPLPAEGVLRDKLAAYAPIYAALFGTPGVLTVQAGSENDGLHDAPYDQRIAAHYNRVRVGYFTALTSGLDDAGRGDIAALQGWPARAEADIFVNTGVLPARPWPFNRTPLLQSDDFSAALMPVTAAHTSWVTPLALARMVHLRFSRFPDRPFDDALIAAIFDAATPALCPGQWDNRCAFQDPMLHGQTEAVRLGHRPREYTGMP
ncbi:hypothetical protein FHR20_002003 [Sphingomonas leidyi]|uniref:Lipoprotein n=1 Tax=Sphingomonas leidyi TaxID=68569 RepID=A0A7X5V0A3_9SPHN|nr:hypothetical protein [Sphingomonas leidyi]NIJ65041.1 hypothetical protein [Sphingomonas leidyi]